MDTITRKELRERINALECLDSVVAAIDDVKCHEFEDGESQEFSIEITASNKDELITFANNVSPAVLIIGLNAMVVALAQEQAA